MSKANYDSLLSPGQKLTEEQFEGDRAVVALAGAVRPFNRRSFLGSFMAASAAVAAGTLVPHEASAQSTTPSIVDVLNFALNLEYLEANLYFAVTGGSLPTADRGTAPGAVTNAPTQLTLDAATSELASALALDEQHHIETLRSTITSLGGTPISQPAINLAMPNKALITTQTQFLAIARQFTAVGGSAYIGGAQYLVSNPAVLTAAAQILAAEGYHDGAVNYQLVKQGTYAQSAPVDALDVVPNSALYFTLYPTTNAVTNSAMPPALAPVRTTAQVLGIVYGVSTSGTTIPPSGVTSGGFFPSGLNGNIKST